MIPTPNQVNFEKVNMFSLAVLFLENLKRKEN